MTTCHPFLWWGLVGGGKKESLWSPALTPFPTETDAGSTEAHCPEGPQRCQQPGAASTRIRLHSESSALRGLARGLVPWLGQCTSCVTSLGASTSSPVNWGQEFLPGGISVKVNRGYKCVALGPGRSAGARCRWGPLLGVPLHFWNEGQ